MARRIETESYDSSTKPSRYPGGDVLGLTALTSLSAQQSTQSSVLVEMESKTKWMQGTNQGEVQEIVFPG